MSSVHSWWVSLRERVLLPDAGPGGHGSAATEAAQRRRACGTTSGSVNGCRISGWSANTSS